MSYARVGEYGSDVYVYRKSPHLIVCHYGPHTFEASSEQEMLEHLHLHRRRGHSVPDRAFDRLICERDGIPYETDVEFAMREMQEENEAMQHVANEVRADLGLPPLEAPNLITGYQKRDPE